MSGNGPLTLLLKLATDGDRRGITRAMKDADDHHHIRQWPIIDRIGTMEGHPQTGSQLVAGSP